MTYLVTGTSSHDWSGRSFINHRVTSRLWNDLGAGRHAIMPAPSPSLGGKGPMNEANGLDPTAQSRNPLSKSHRARLSNVETLTNPCMVDHLSKIPGTNSLKKKEQSFCHFLYRSLASWDEYQKHNALHQYLEVSRLEKYEHLCDNLKVHHAYHTYIMYHGVR